MSDPVVEAMEAGAGLPVLKPLDRLLEQRSLDTEAPAEVESVESLLDAVDEWLDAVEARVHERLDDAHEGPLGARIPRRLDERWTPVRGEVDAIRGRLDDEVPWPAIVSLLEELQGLREEATHLQRAAGHLSELARLLEDVPDDGEGRQALDELAEQEARAVSREDAEAWARAARELEEAALDAVRLHTPPEEPANPEPEPDAGPAGATNGANGVGQAPDGPADETVDEPNDGSGDETGELFAASGPGALSLKPRQRPATPNGSNGSNGALDLESATTEPEVEANTPASPGPTAERPAGPEVLEGWASAGDGELRHSPFWAPIREGLIVASEEDEQALIETAAEVEVDLVDLELPRILATATGGGPEAVRERIAERAAEITRRDPERQAREAFLDYLVGKLPQRYRETAWGRALVASIAHAVCTEEAWTAAGPGYEDTLARMVHAELERTPAVDVAALAESLVGTSTKAREAVEAAARRVADEDPRVRHREDGMLVRALAEHEDPDALYDLKQRLARRLGDERAQALVTALIETGEETP